MLLSHRLVDRLRLATVDWVAAIALGVLLALRLFQMADPVSGLDGGNWLALANGLLGKATKAASTAYPPLYLLLLDAGKLIWPPLVALRVTAALVGVLPGLGAHVLLRVLGLRWRALIGLLASTIGYTLEMLAWGGYPQLLGTGLQLGSLAFLALGLRAGHARHFALAGGLGGAAVLANQLSGMQAIVALGVATATMAIADPERRSGILQGSLIAASACGVVIAPSLPAYVRIVANTSATAFNAQGNDNLLGMLAYVISEGRYQWVIPFGSIAIAVSMLARRRDWIALATLAGLLVASIGGAAITFEVRFLHLALIAAIAAFALALPAGKQTDRAIWPRLPEIMVAIAVALSLGVTGYQRYDQSKVYYRVLDGSLVEGLDWLARNSDSGDLAASGPGPRNWALGWWVEGLAGVPTYAETDERWVAFRDEKLYSQIARRILSSSDPLEAAALAQERGITLLVLDARGNARADEWLRTGRVDGPIRVVYRNPSLDVFRVARPDEP